ncbi:rhomboid-related protein 4 isoform X1 [Denticeps clupeoides]|uniref:Peptidase S54 rhomboid domain-containing protein n=1 Tax=Denticeps clupeoides TaxID=299321 RepID=A0AAY4C767_9TELE|nr:rhomboid-related protein 4 isoform X1 [Denticeps clupeoides]
MVLSSSATPGQTLPSHFTLLMMQRRHRGSNLGLILLASQIFQIGLDNIPPVTLATLGVNVYLFLFPAAPLLSACVSVQTAYWHRDWRRLILSPFHHVDDWHLYFNMASLLWKGIKLERRLGGAWFAYLLSVFSLLTGSMYLLLEAVLTEVTGDGSYSMQCAVGFSGVLFGLKVVNNYYHPGGVTHVMGFLVSNRYACWVELVLIHIMSPGTSFVGHLAGILVGLLYTAGPLKKVMKTCADFVTSSRPSHVYYNSSGPSGRYNPHYYPSSDGQPHTGPYPQPLYQHPYTAGMSDAEQYDAAVRASLNDRGGRQTYGFRVASDPNLEEIRQRRLQRFATER